MELDALLQCISRKEGIEASKARAVSNFTFYLIIILGKLKEDKDTVEKMSSGKFTLKGMFSSQSGKASKTQNILQTISQTEKDIQNYDIIKNYLIIYLQEIAIPAFKHQKMKNYVAAMLTFCD